MSAEGLIKIIEKAIDDIEEEYNSILLCEATIDDIEEEIKRRVFPPYPSKGEWWDGDEIELIKFLFTIKRNSFNDLMKLEHFLKVTDNYTLEQIESLIP